jgi:hypothetical protein
MIITRTGENVLKIRVLGPKPRCAWQYSDTDATSKGKIHTFRKSIMNTLLFSMPGGTEWIILVFGLILPIAAAYIIYNLARKGIKSAVKEAIEELKQEGKI